MTRENSRQRMKTFARLLEKYGVPKFDETGNQVGYMILCAEVTCKKELNWSSACCDHIDNDDDNTSFVNRQFLCRSCNNLKDPLGKIRNLDKQSEVPATMKLGSHYEYKFLRWLRGIIELEGKIKLERAIGEGALEVGCVPKTIQNEYIPKYVNDHPKSEYTKKVMDAEGNEYIVFKDAIQLELNKDDFTKGQHYNEFEKNLARQIQGVRFKGDEDYDDWIKAGRPIWTSTVKLDTLPLNSTSMQSN